MSVSTPCSKKDQRLPSNSMRPPLKTLKRSRMLYKKLTVLVQNKMALHSQRLPIRPYWRCPKHKHNSLELKIYADVLITRYKARARILQMAVHVARIPVLYRQLCLEWLFVTDAKVTRKLKSVSVKINSKIKSYWSSSKRTLFGRKPKLWSYRSALALSKVRSTNGTGTCSENLRNIKERVKKLVLARPTSLTILVGK